MLELVRAYDAALCHNIYDVVDPKLGRLLNAERVKALNLPTPKIFRWKDHEAKLHEQFKGTSEEDDLITFFHAAREDNVPVSLWVSERRSSRSLLEKDGVKLKEKAWLAWTTHLIPNDERTILKVPANREMAAYDSGNGYTMEHLEEAIATADPGSFKRFRASSVTNPLGKRILHLHRLLAAGLPPKESRPPATGKKNESFSANQDRGKSTKNPRNRKQKSSEPAANSDPTGSLGQSKKVSADVGPDNISSLPQRKASLTPTDTTSAPRHWRPILYLLYILYLLQFGQNFQGGMLDRMDRTHECGTCGMLQIKALAAAWQ